MTSASGDAALYRIANALEKMIDIVTKVTEEPEPGTCRLVTMPAYDVAVTDAVNKLMGPKQMTRSELHEIVNDVYNEGIRSVAHERG